MALPFLANNLPSDESDRAQALFDEAVQVAQRRLHPGVAFGIASKGALATRHVRLVNRVEGSVRLC